MNEKIQEDVYLTPGQYLQLAKIRAQGLKDNKSFKSIKQRGLDLAEVEIMKQWLWDFLELPQVRGANE